MTVLRTRPGIPIAAVGLWQAMTGEWECTADQLADAVRAQSDPSFRTPVLKLGHVDPRFQAQPAVGRLENLRLSDDGQQLLADLVGIPAWLDDVLETAYPSRSVEAMLDVTTTAGAEYLMVVTGCALLGVTAPAIESLGDIADLFGVPTQVDAYVAAALVAAAALPPGVPVPRRLGQVVASASIDALSSAAEEWAESQPLLGCDHWVRDIYTDAVIFTAWMPDGESKLYRVPWSETSDGVFAFGPPVEVRQVYEPIPGAAADPGVEPGAVAAATLPFSLHLLSRDTGRQRLHRVTSGAVPSQRGRDVTAGAHPLETHVPISPAVAAELGLAEDATDEQVLAALRARTTPTPAATTEEGGTTTSAPAPAPTEPAAPVADVERLIAASVQSAVDRVTAPLLAQIETLSGQVAASNAEKANDVRTRVITAAVRDGKITPAQRAQWEAHYDKTPDVTTSILASLKPGTAVPISAAGHVAGEELGEDAALMAALGYAPDGSVLNG